MGFTFLHQANTPYIEMLLAQYAENPVTLEPTWRTFFDGLSFANGARAEAALSTDDIAFEFKVFRLIQAIRHLGYLIADVNPLDRTPKHHELLEPKHYGLTDDDLARPTLIGEQLGISGETVADIIAALGTAYCSGLAVEYAAISDPKARNWMQARIESGELHQPFDAAAKRRTLELLQKTEGFESFLHKRFVGQKRFSCEGNDAMIPMIDLLIEEAAKRGAEELIFGMAHRGRLSLLANVFNKDLPSIFAEFVGNLEASALPGDGDVKYHLGFSGDVTTAAGKDVHISLVSNPSHLEAVNPVIMGIARAKQKLQNDRDQQKILAVLLHGDASFAGQGSIYELLNMSELSGYSIGGIIHIVINNQIGFTTLPADARSTPNATDAAKMLEAPVLRVNSDEPELCLRAMLLAIEYRAAFKRDIFIDLIGYRRYGHNEGDEPSFTQPSMYEVIGRHPRVAAQYADRLIAENVAARHEVDASIAKIYEKLDAVLGHVKSAKIPRPSTAFQKAWEGLESVPQDERFFAPVKTGVPTSQLKTIGEKLIALPDDFHPHPKILRGFEDRKEMLEGKRPLDWGMGEALAFGTLLSGEFAIRLAGQDCERGTFSHRHSVLYDVQTNEKHIPLNHLGAKADYEVVNSLLSEFAAMGFEFGQSTADPRKLVIWEAQFGDFANGAQIIIDQFLVGSASKWQRSSGLCLFLPHGYEGMGPEHSSARLERFLQACAQHNIQVCNATTPAQFFHLLRRQMHRPFRLPLILLTPKSLLRHPKATSRLDDLSTGHFEEFLDDPQGKQFSTAKRIILTSGKIYYELLEARDARKLAVPLLRVEQFYPFHQSKLKQILSRYKKTETVCWCQEEAQNMGGWRFMVEQLTPLLDRGQTLQYVGRPPQASVSGGYAHVHEHEQRAIVDQALKE